MKNIVSPYREFKSSIDIRFSMENFECQWLITMRFCVNAFKYGSNYNSSITFINVAFNLFLQKYLWIINKIEFFASKPIILHLIFTISICIEEFFLIFKQNTVIGWWDSNKSVIRNGAKGSDFPNQMLFWTPHIAFYMTRASIFAEFLNR